MSTKTRRAKIWFPGTIVSEGSYVDAGDKSIEQVAAAHPRGYCIRMYEHIETEVDGVKCTGDKPISPVSWYGGRIVTAEEAIAANGENSIAASSIRCNKYERLYETRWGGLYPMNTGDVAIEVAAP